MPVGQSLYPTSLDTVADLIEAGDDLSTSLTAQLNAGAATANVAATAAWPNSTLIVITSGAGVEIASYDSKTGTTFGSLTRGLYGTSDLTHTLPATVEHLIVARHHNVLSEGLRAVQRNVERAVKVAGAALSGHRAVKLGSGQAVYVSNADADADAVFGITTHAASSGADVDILRAGEITEPSWAWTPNGLIFLSTNGQLTQTPPASGALIEMGVALAATRMLVRIQRAIFI